jgi:hypothetical protein
MRLSHDQKSGKPVTRYFARYFGSDGKVVRTAMLTAKTIPKAVHEAQAILGKGGLISVDPFINDSLADFWKVDLPHVKLAVLRGRPFSTSTSRTRPGLETVQIGDLEFDIFNWD